jgi:DNA-binding transcriptional ArsR family regulator
MFRLEMGPDDLTASRFAISPLHETVVAVRALAGMGPGADAVLRRWLEPKRALLENLRRTMPVADLLSGLLSASMSTPTFLAPPPRRAHGTLAAQLDDVRATPLPLARADIAGCLADSTQPFSPAVQDSLDQPDIAIRVAHALEAAWNELIRPDWPVIHAILQQDLQHWARRLIGQGWSGMLPHLPMGSLSWCADSNVQTLQGPLPVDEQYRPGGGGIVFGPTLAAEPSLVLEPGWQREIRYPALGRGSLFRHAQPPVRNPLGKLIGQTRSRLLVELGRPATTTQLTRIHQLSLGTVAHHLSALRAAGLVTSIRDGQSVVYHRTPLGDSLVDANLP